MAYRLGALGSFLARLVGAFLVSLVATLGICVDQWDVVMRGVTRVERQKASDKKGRVGPWTRRRGEGTCSEGWGVVWVRVKVKMRRVTSQRGIATRQPERGEGRVQIA